MSVNRRILELYLDKEINFCNERIEKTHDEQAIFYRGCKSGIEALKLNLTCGIFDENTDHSGR